MFQYKVLKIFWPLWIYNKVRGKCVVRELQNESSSKVAYVLSEDSDQLSHSQKLFRVFAVHLKAS